MKPKNNAENFGDCVCADCPVYTECNRRSGERIFCARKISECETDSKKPCLCPVKCPVYTRNKLIGAYFCQIPLEE